MPAQRVHDLVHGRRALTPAMEARFRLHLQTRYDLERAADALEGRLEREVSRLVA